MLRILAVLLLSLVFAGCTMFTRTIYVPEGKMIRLRQAFKNAKIWVKEKDGNIAEGRMDVPEGWYCAPKDAE